MEFKEEPYPTYYGNRLTKYRTTVYISNRAIDSCYFVCFWDPFYKIGEYTKFSGIFFPISYGSNQTFNIRKRNFVDALNPFSKNTSSKTGLSAFDSKVVIKNPDQAQLPKLFRSSKAHYLFFQALDIDKAMTIGINELNLDFVPALKNKPHFGIYTRQEWFLDPQDIEELFEIGEKIRRI